MKTPIYFFTLILSILTSCNFITIQKVSDTPGLYSGYHCLNDELKSRIIFSTIEEPKSIDPLKVNAIDGITMKSILDNNDSSLIYFWSPNCHSDYCVNPLALQEYCDSVNLEFILIAEYFNKGYLQTLPKEYIIYGINNNVYNTDVCNKYLKLFKKDVFGKNSKELYYVYKNGEAQVFDISPFL